MNVETALAGEWQILGRLLFASPDAIRSCVRHIMLIDRVCGFRRRFKPGTLVRPEIFASRYSSKDPNAGSRSLLFSGVDLTHMSEACINDFRYIIARAVRAKALAKTTAARRYLEGDLGETMTSRRKRKRTDETRHTATVELSAYNIDYETDEDDGTRGYGYTEDEDYNVTNDNVAVPVDYETPQQRADAERIVASAVRQQERYSAIDAVGSADIMLECLLQYIAPGMTLPFADDLIVPEIAIFIMEALRLETGFTTLAAATLGVRSDFKLGKMRLAIFGNDMHHIRVWNPAFLELPIVDIFNLTKNATASVPIYESRALQRHGPVADVLNRIRELDPDLSKSFVDINKRTADIRMTRPQTRLKYEGFRYNSAFFDAYDGWFWVLNYLLEIVDAICGVIQMDVNSDNEVLYYSYVQWLESALSVVCLVKMDDESKHPDLLRIGSLYMSPHELAKHAHRWRTCLDPHELLGFWGELGCVYPKVDTVRHYNYTEEMYAMSSASNNGSSPSNADPMEHFARTLSSDRTTPELLRPLRDADAWDAWRHAHSSLYKTQSGQSIWFAIQSGLHDLVGDYSKNVTAPKWQTPLARSADS